jgi:acylphosphatase
MDAMNAELETIQIIVKGKVQGVFFRQSAKEKAKNFGITGHVKNAPNEEVHIVATGPKDQLQNFIRWCREGPPRAIVKNVFIQSLPLQNFETFNIER